MKTAIIVILVILLIVQSARILWPRFIEARQDAVAKLDRETGYLRKIQELVRDKSMLQAKINAFSPEVIHCAEESINTYDGALFRVVIGCELTNEVRMLKQILKRCQGIDWLIRYGYIQISEKGDGDGGSGEVG